MSRLRNRLQRPNAGRLASTVEERLCSFLQENGPASTEELIDCFLGRTTGNRQLASRLLHQYLRDHPQLFKPDGKRWQLVGGPSAAIRLPPQEREEQALCLLLIEKGPPDAPLALGLVRQEPDGATRWMAVHARKSSGRTDFMILGDDLEESAQPETAEQARRLVQQFVVGSALWYLGRSADLARMRRFWDSESWNPPLPLWPAARRLLVLPAAIRPDALARLLNLPEGQEQADSPAARLRWWMEALQQVNSRLAEQGIHGPAAVQSWLAQPAAAPDFSAFGFDRSDLLAVPEQPGVYCFRERSGGLLYVGKSKNLRRRLLSYFHPGSAGRSRKRFLLTKIHSFEYHSLRSDLEALVSESRLIQQLDPALNVQQSVRSPQAGYFAVNPAIALFPCPDRENVLELWCLCPGRRARQLVFDGTAKGLHRTRQALARIYGRPVRRRKIQLEGESLLVASWLHRNRQAANWIDVQKVGDIEEILRQLQMYASAGRDLSRQRIIFR